MMIFCLFLPALILFFLVCMFIDMHPDRGSSRDLPTTQSAWVDLTLAGPVREGRLFRAMNPRGLVVILHNYGASKNRYYAMADDLAKAGYHAFLFDFRGHGKNYTRLATWLIGFAPHLMGDVQGLIAELRSREEFRSLPVYLLGYSLGSGIALEVFKRDASLAGLVCDSGPFTLIPRVCILLIERVVPTRPRFYQWIITYFFCVVVNRPRAFRVLNQLERCEGRRIFIIESSRETFIPLGEMHELQKRWPGTCTYWRVERAQHVMAYSVDKKEYIRRMVEFLEGK